MSYQNQNIEINCKYCLSDENSDDLVSVCSCRGNLKYTHKTCLERWFNSKPLIGNFKCEICKTEIKCKIKKRLQIYAELFLSVFIVSILLIFSYICFGIFFVNIDITFYTVNVYWHDVFINGVITTHITLGIFMVALLLYGIFTNRIEYETNIVLLVFFSFLFSICFVYISIFAHIVNKKDNYTLEFQV